MPSAAELFSLEGTVALVTGGATGLGLATVEVLASAGAHTVLCSLPADEPEAVARELADRGLPVTGRACDVADERELDLLVEWVLATHGRIDTVFCNAGVALDTGPHTSSTDAQLDRMFDIHVRSPLRLANRTIPQMAERGDGAFIIMSSLSGLRGNSMLGLYGITKAANAQLARNLAVQWGHSGVRVNAISPGVIATEFAKPITEGAGRDARLAKTPMRRFGDPSHVAGTVLWLASRAGGFTSGQNIVVDGGTLVSD
ncbi:SDR family oxidoreductase [Salinibacterium sp. SYSU T00001]|uniref:SDR family NAD(P)-dependent oxidoreductase n=1 Tax=Homoserinimonas sedimenticola TaxID=2986805 RepID=UPI002235AB4E|nr:SDR family oxidoreductase [Salinibacterium sedimenticola]MCW4385648.1 SDR family oxidoreductase [Salinibacterium sedimenticola]